MESFSTISVDVTEEIDSKNLGLFIQTQIGLKDILISKESLYYCVFIPELLRYEILLFRDKQSVFNSGVFYLSKLCKDNSYTLFILEEFFCVYKNSKPLFVKQVSNISKEDIKSYLEQTYNITPLDIQYVDKNEINTLKEQLDENSKKMMEKSLKKIITTNSFNYFLSYCLIVASVFSFFIYDKLHKETNLDHNDTITKTTYSKEFVTYKKHLKDNNLQILLSFISYLKRNEITINGVKYLKGKFELSLRSKDKKNLLKLLEYPDKNIELLSLQFEKEQELYLMEAVLYG